MLLEIWTLLMGALACYPCADQEIAGAVLDVPPVAAPGPTVEVVVRVNGPPAAENAREQEVATVVAVRMDSGLPWVDELPRVGIPPKRVAVGGEIRMRVPVDRQLGFAAFSASRGYAETVVEAGTWAPSKESGGEPTTAPSITLELPAPSAAGRLELVEVGGGPGSLTVEARLPLTGVVVGSDGRGRRSELGGIELPPGLFDVSVRPSQWLMCGDGAPVEDTALGALCPVVIRANRTSRIRHRYGPARSLKVEIVLASMTAERIFEAKQTEAYLQSGWWRQARIDEPDHWYVHATLQRKDPGTGELSKPMRLTWGWPGCFFNTERFVVPLGFDLYSIPLLAPGDYVLTVRGPRVKTLRHSFRHHVGNGSQGRREVIEVEARH